MKTIEQLQEENASLAAQVEALREHASDAAGALGFLSHHLRGRMGEAALMDMAEKADALTEALAATPQHHLREVRAEAGRAALKPLRDEWEKNDAHEVSAEEKLERLVGMIYKSTETI